MGCFSIFPCFSSSKHHSKLHKSVIPIFSPDQGHDKNCETVLARIPTEQSSNIGSIQTPVSELGDNSEDQVTNDCNSKPVAADLDIEKKENGKLAVLMQIQNESKTDKQINAGVQVEIEPEAESQNLDVTVELENESNRENEEKTEVLVLHNGTISDSSVSSCISIPIMDRYHNSVINEDKDQVVIQEDSTDSLFSLSIHPKSQSKSCPVEVNDDKEVNSPMKPTSSPKENDYNKNIDSLFNPVENLAQWKTGHAIPEVPILDLHQEKENLYLEQDHEHVTIPVSEDPSFKVLDPKGKVKDNTAVVSVTTSLSNWLVDFEKSVTVSKEESQFSTGNSYSCSDGAAASWRSFEDRPILGAWTIDEVKQISARSSPRKSPRNPGETPIIGSVGSYWNHSAQGADSSSSSTSPLGMSAKSRRNREHKGLSCHSSPAKRRLERAMNKKNAV